MKFTCDKQILQNAISVASRASAGKSPMPVLEGLLIEAGTDVRVTGYDLKKGIYTNFEAQVKEPGSVILGARLLGDIARSLPEEIVEIECDSNNATRILCGNADFSIMGSHSDEYPELPQIDYENAVEIDAAVLKDMINETIFSVSDNESRPVYTGSLFEIKGDILTIVSVDGYRLALRREKINQSDMDITSFIVPGSSLGEVEKICSGDETVKITVGSKHISFTSADTVLISRRLEGEFLNYKNSIPTEFSVKVKAQRTDFMRVVDRVSLLIDDKVKNPLRCIFDAGSIKFHCATSLGKAEDILPIDGDGGGLEIGFNNRYLREALRVAPAEKLCICLNTGTTPCIILPEDGDDDSFLYMILPVRLKSGD